MASMEDAMNRIKVDLPQTEYSALLTLAINDLRPIDRQVRFIIRQELERRGLLETETVSPQGIQPKGEGADDVK